MHEPTILTQRNKEIWFLMGKKWCEYWACFKEFHPEILVRTVFSVVEIPTYLISLSGKSLSSHTPRALVFHWTTAMYAMTILTMYTLNSPHCSRGTTQSWSIQWQLGCWVLLLSDRMEESWSLLHLGLLHKFGMSCNTSSWPCQLASLLSTVFVGEVYVWPWQQSGL